MKKIKRKKLFIIVAVVLIFGFFFFYYKSNLERSPLYDKMKIYLTEEKWESDNSFTKNSAEDYFNQGVILYLENNVKEAQILFKKAELKKSNDPILPIYISYFLNNCQEEIDGSGSIQRVGFILESIKKYPELANDIDFIWKVCTPVLDNKDSRKTMAYLLERYIKEVKSLSFINTLKLKGYIAIFKMLNQNYAESIYIFYEIIAESEKIKDINTRNMVKIKAQEYIANMHFMLEDYETAIKLYNYLIIINIDDPYENARVKYGAYANRTTSYILSEQYEKARAATEETKKVIPYLASDISDGVKVFRYNNMAMIEIREKDFHKAAAYLKEAETLLKGNNNNKGFLNNDVYLALSHCELLVGENRLEEAEKALTTLAEINDERHLGFEKEIYTLQMEVYKKSNQQDKYFQVHNKIVKLDNEFTQQLKKDYLKFIEKSFVLEQMKKQERISQLKIKSLIGAGGIILFFIIFQTVRIIKLRKNNFTDSLTGAYNRKYLNEFFKKKTKKNSLINIGVVMTDIDYFKKYNDSYGHIKGDTVIKETALTLKNSISKDEAVIRYGGEEFLILLNDRSLSDIDNLCQEILKNLKEKNIPHRESEAADRVTLSMGISNGSISTIEELLDLIKKADKALYKAKANGRNQFIFYN